MRAGQVERADNNQLHQVGIYLRALREDEWFHFGEL